MYATLTFIQKKKNQIKNLSKKEWKILVEESLIQKVTLVSIQSHLVHFPIKFDGMLKVMLEYYLLCLISISLTIFFKKNWRKEKRKEKDIFTILSTSSWISFIPSKVFLSSSNCSSISNRKWFFFFFLMEKKKKINNNTQRSRRRRSKDVIQWVKSWYLIYLIYCLIAYIRLLFYLIRIL